jgi:hypothetical protein
MVPVRRAVAEGDVAEDLKGEVADLRTDMRTEFATVRGDMREGFAALRGEMQEANYGAAAPNGRPLTRERPAEPYVTVAVANGTSSVSPTKAR